MFKIVDFVGVVDEVIWRVGVFGVYVDGFCS